MLIEKGSKVILRIFLGSPSPYKQTPGNENYWILIGQGGDVLEVSDGKALVLFNADLDVLGLENHNPQKNSLWISMSDLEPMGSYSLIVNI